MSGRDARIDWAGPEVLLAALRQKARIRRDRRRDAGGRDRQQRGHVQPGAIAAAAALSIRRSGAAGAAARNPAGRRGRLWAPGPGRRDRPAGRQHHLRRGDALPLRRAQPDRERLSGTGPQLRDRRRSVLGLASQAAPRPHLPPGRRPTGAGSRRHSQPRPVAATLRRLHRCAGPIGAARRRRLHRDRDHARGRHLSQGGRGLGAAGAEHRRSDRAGRLLAGSPGSDSQRQVDRAGARRACELQRAAGATVSADQCGAQSRSDPLARRAVRVHLAVLLHAAGRRGLGAAAGLRQRRQPASDPAGGARPRDRGPRGVGGRPGPPAPAVHPGIAGSGVGRRSACRPGGALGGDLDPHHHARGDHDLGGGLERDRRGSRRPRVRAGADRAGGRPVRVDQQPAPLSGDPAGPASRRWHRNLGPPEGLVAQAAWSPPKPASL